MKLCPFTPASFTPASCGRSGSSTAVNTWHVSLPATLSSDGRLSGARFPGASVHPAVRWARGSIESGLFWFPFPLAALVVHQSG